MDFRPTSLDTSIRIVTPENIEFSHRVAGPFHRLIAYLIDTLLFILILAFLAFVISMTFGSIGRGDVGIGLLLALVFFLWHFYFGALEALWNGQTPGKRLLRLRVVKMDGQPINAREAIARNLIRIVDSCPLIPLGVLGIVSYQLGLFVAASNNRFQRIGDYVAGTMVIVEEARWLKGSIQFRDAIVHRFAEQIPASYRPSPTLARALGLYVERRRFLSPPRRIEIARHVSEPLLEQLRLPPQTNPDLLLCALYQKTFGVEKAAPSSSPFNNPAAPSYSTSPASGGQPRPLFPQSGPPKVE